MYEHKPGARINAPFPSFHPLPNHWGGAPLYISAGASKFRPGISRVNHFVQNVDRAELRAQTAARKPGPDDQ